MGYLTDRRGALRQDARNLLRHAKVSLQISGREHIDRRRSYVVMSNHQSHYDIPVMFQALGTRVRMIAKTELFKIPVMGRAMLDSGFIELDRPPAAFRVYAEARGDGAESGAIGASLLAFEESPTAMVIMQMDGTIVKVNRALRELIGYAEGELVGAPASTFSASAAGKAPWRASTNAIWARRRCASMNP